MSKRSGFLWLGLASAVWAPSQAAAGVIYDNIGPGYAGDSTEGYGSGGGYFGTTFITSAGGTLTQLIVGVGSDVATMAPAALYANSDGEPGTLLESWNVTLPYSTGNTVTLTSVLNPVLSAGTQYWLVFGPGAEADGVQLTGNDTGVPGAPWQGDTLTGLSTDPGPDDLAPGIELIGQTSAPEPGTAGLIAIACVALALVRHAR